MTLNIETIRTALKTQIAAAVTTLNVYDYPPDSPTLDALLILPNPAEDSRYVHYHGTFGPSSLCTVGFRLELRVGGSHVDAMKAADAYMSSGVSGSITDALEADKTLSGAVGDVYGAGWTTPGWFAATETDTRTWLAATFDLVLRKAR